MIFGRIPESTPDFTPFDFDFEILGIRIYFLWQVCPYPHFLLWIVDAPSSSLNIFGVINFLIHCGDMGEGSAGNNPDPF